MRSSWKGSYIVGGFVRYFVSELVVALVIDSGIKAALKGNFDNLFNFSKYINESGDLYFYNRALVYEVELFKGVARFFLYNGRHFIWLRQLAASHGGVKFGEMSFTKKSGRRIHLKSIMRRKQRKASGRK